MNLLDTTRACVERQESVRLYIGGGKPHFPVPAMTNQAIAKSIFSELRKAEAWKRRKWRINTNNEIVGRDIYNVGE